MHIEPQKYHLQNRDIKGKFYNVAHQSSSSNNNNNNHWWYLDLSQIWNYIDNDKAIMKSI